MNYISKTENKILMRQALDSLKGRWGIAIGTLIVFTVIMIVMQLIPVVGWIASLLISGPLGIGMACFTLSVSRRQDPNLQQLFSGFQNYGTALAAYILTMIFIFLWALLLIVPGIIAGLSYSMTYFIIADNRAIGPMDAIRKSKEMMRGNKWKLFCLGLRFIGWGLLGLLTLCIGYLWLFPYIYVSIAQFYDDLKENNMQIIETQTRPAGL